MKKINITLLSILAAFLSFGQQYSTEFGKIAKDEYLLKTYEKDPDVEAVILFDVGESFFEYSYEEGFNIQFTRTKRIKILNEAGLDFANITIPYYVDGYGRTEKIREIEAYVYNLKDGYQPTRVELQQSAIFDEQLSKYYRAKKFALPDVKPGSIIEYKYVLWTPFHFNLPDWEFQDKIPTVYSKYTVKMIPFYEYVYLLQGGTLDEKDSYVQKGLDRSVRGISYQDYVHTFVKKDVPAFKDESFISTRQDYIVKIDFQLAKVRQLNGAISDIMTTWPELIKEHLDYENFGKYINQAQKYAEKELIPTLPLTGLSDLDKTKLIIEKIKADYTWNNNYGRYATQNLKSFLSSKNGSAADINLFALGVLKAAGIQADPLILSTRDHGKISSYHPFNHFFNYVIVLVETDGNLLLTDATEPLLSYDRIPPYCINDMGLVVKKTQEENWINLNTVGIGSQSYSITLKPHADAMSAEYVIIQQNRDFLAYREKQKYGDNLEKMEAELEKNEYFQVDKIQSKNYEKNSLPYIISHAGTVNLESLQGKLVIKPFLDIPISRNPFKQNERSYPVDFIYRQKYDFSCNLMIPEGYVLEFVPNNEQFSDELMDFTYQITQNQGFLAVQSSYALKNPFILPEHYHTIKNHFDLLLQKLNESIVLKASE